MLHLSPFFYSEDLDLAWVFQKRVETFSPSKKMEEIYSDFDEHIFVNWAWTQPSRSLWMNLRSWKKISSHVISSHKNLPIPSIWAESVLQTTCTFLGTQNLGFQTWNSQVSMVGLPEQPVATRWGLNTNQLIWEAILTSPKNCIQDCQRSTSRNAIYMKPTNFLRLKLL